MDFNIEDFIASVNSDRSQGGNYLTLNKLAMNARNLQGLVTFIPIMSQGPKSSNNFYTKIEKVTEINAPNSNYDDSLWYKILPLTAYENITDAEVELYHEVRGYLTWLYENEYLDYNSYRIRNYVLFHGIITRMKPSDPLAQVESDYLNAPALMVYPNLTVINSMADAIQSKIANSTRDTEEGKREWIPKVLSPNLKGRRGVMSIDFKLEGTRYSATTQFLMNSEDEKYIDPEFEISQEIVNLYDDVLPKFMGWNYDKDSDRLFNRNNFLELRDYLKRWRMDVDPTFKAEVEASNKLEGVAEVVVENKNNLTSETPTQVTVEVSQAPSAKPTGGAPF